MDWKPLINEKVLIRTTGGEFRPAYFYGMEDDSYIFKWELSKAYIALPSLVQVQPIYLMQSTI